MQHRNRLALRIQRDGGEFQASVAYGLQCGGIGHTDLPGVIAHLPGSALVGQTHGEQGAGVLFPVAGAGGGRAQALALRRRGVVVQQAGIEELADRAQRGRHPDRVDVVGIAAAADALVAVAPLTHLGAGLERDQVRVHRLAREGFAAGGDEQQVAHQRIALPPGPELAGQEGAGAVAPARILQQPCGRDRRQHEVAVDHRVVVDRRRRRLALLLEMLQYRELADALLVRDLAIRRKTRQHRGDPGVDRHRLQHRHQQAQRHQRVAAEIGIETPGAGEEFLAVAEEPQCLAAA